jgi:hypothetical protein
MKTGKKIKTHTIPKPIKIVVPIPIEIPKKVEVEK